MSILPEHKEILIAESNSKTLPEWLEYFDNQYTKNMIYSFCYRNGLKVQKLSKEQISKIQSNNSRKYHINQDFFKTWSRDMAYILGFWFADGCIYGGKMFDITIHKKDKYILKLIADKLNYEGPINDYVDRQAARLNFSCVVIYNDIIALGGKESKSNDVDFPFVPDEFLPDFIRGYFDGDGCVMNLKNNRLNSAFTSGSEKFRNKLLQILRDKAGVEGGSFDKQASIRFGKKDTIKIGKYIYQNNPQMFLLRKYNKFKNYI